MGPARKAQKPIKVSVPRSTRNRTRLHKSKLITDPAQTTLQLTNQLRGLGLYAAPTLGDGNCLFRALADQLWGSPNGHLTLRAEVCDWMEARKDRYEGFVDEDRSFDSHIMCMRVPGTYGGHLELSAFAHLKRRHVKVIQPGLVYIIEWGGDDNPSPSVEVEPMDETGLNERDKRRLRRDRKKQEKQKEKAVEATEQGGTVYVAYHDWEHFSSVRNLAGPHTGLPNVVERPECPGHVQEELPPPPPSPSKGKGKAPPSRVKAQAKTTIVLTPSTAIDTLPAAQVPLPPSRSPSPSTASSSLSPPLSQTASTESGSTAPSSIAPLTPPDISSLAHNGRSPKRSFDESQEHPPRPPASTKRRRKRPSDTMDLDHGLDPDENTPSLSDDSSQSGLSALISSSALPSPPPTPPIEPEPQPEPPQKPLTRRQRKALGIPHPRTTVITASKTRSAGKIVIPGGRRALRSSTKLENTDVSGEWQTNGTGRLDVRGFRELKI